MGNNVTCNANNLNIRQPRNENGRVMTKYQETYTWNKLPEAIIGESPSFPTFKRKL